MVWFDLESEFFCRMYNTIELIKNIRRQNVFLKNFCENLDIINTKYISY